MLKLSIIPIKTRMLTQITRLYDTQFKKFNREPVIDLNWTADNGLERAGAISETPD